MDNYSFSETNVLIIYYLNPEKSGKIQISVTVTMTLLPPSSQNNNRSTNNHANYFKTYNSKIQF